LHYVENIEINDKTIIINPEQPASFNPLFESIIIEKLSQKHNNVSSCFSCNKYFGESFPVDRRNIVEVNCDGLLNCSFCEVSDEYKNEIFPQDFVILQNDESIEVAQVKIIGEMVRLKRQYMHLFGETLPKVLRKTTIEDLEKVTKNIYDEQKAVPKFKELNNKFNLNMKLISVHYQFDRKKLFFFYTADGRVDFRELAKELAAEFRTRIELRQIGVRDEAKKVGGLGTCGREYCCISFLPCFKKITSHLAVEQNLLSSMGKLTGPCCKLKCCLSFEIE
jgi:cell fate regulator YaaT (PSP1 superfamily)